MKIKLLIDRRMILPVLFSVLSLGVAAAYASVVLILPIPLVIKILIGLCLAGLAAATVFVVVQRTKELKQEDKDDLSKY